MAFEPKQATSLATYLLLYSKAEHDCYIDYMIGAKVLADWLAPIEIPTIDCSSKIPSLLSGYESDQLAKILVLPEKNENISSYLTRIKHMEIAIIFTMITDVLPILLREEL